MKENKVRKICIEWKKHSKYASYTGAIPSKLKQEYHEYWQYISTTDRSRDSNVLSILPLPSRNTWEKQTSPARRM
jgi:hypothetical protein